MSSNSIEIDRKGPPMTQSKLGITEGPLALFNGQDVYPTWDTHARHHVAVFGPEDDAITPEQNKANAELFIDAHNVANRTGLTPGELEKERDEYKRQLDELRELFFTYSGHDDGCDIDPEYVKCTCGYSEVYARLRLTSTESPRRARHPARRR